MRSARLLLVWASSSQMAYRFCCRCWSCSSQSTAFSHYSHAIAMPGRSAVSSTTRRQGLDDGDGPVTGTRGKQRNFLACHGLSIFVGALLPCLSARWRHILSPSKTYFINTTVFLACRLPLRLEPVVVVVVAVFCAYSSLPLLMQHDSKCIDIQISRSMHEYLFDIDWICVFFSAHVDFSRYMGCTSSKYIYNTSYSQYCRAILSDVSAYVLARRAKVKGDFDISRW